ncbi:MAG: FAD-dependent oxidoreductase [Acidobacteriota bacterium]|nr:FAD-dependent oxidoreductase [Acidobacteriota bacterium]
MTSPINRREFLSAALVGLGRKTDPPITGGFVNEDWVRGHQLRDRATFPRTKRQIKVPIVIVGAGIAGLSAAWRLDKRGVRDFGLLEMASQAGGNSRSGENEISAYPWGAHYVPVPNRSATLVRELFEDLGVLRDGVWDERSLCHSPQERLFLHGRWQEDIEPAVGATSRDREQRKRFQDRIEAFRATGEFTIPMETGVRPSALDWLSMKEWMKQQRFDSPYLNWYVDYACRDDYGARARDTSAWAAIHYFASREHDDKGPLTWPEGNGWIVKKLLAKLGRYVRTNAMVYRVSPEGRGWRVFAGDTEYLADFVIFAAPTFLAPYIVEGAQASDGIEYSPWLTANLTLEHAPTENGFEMAWDNTIYDSPALGYVVATHQSLRTHIERSVWTYYWSLADGTPAENRKLLLEKDWQFWKEAILNDLARAHPDIRQCVSHIDIMRMGHAMARPVPGFLQTRTKLSPPRNLFLANSDLSGFSIFEEAQHRGVRAADRAITSASR